MPSGQTIVNNALTDLGILEQGGTPSVSDSNDALTELNSMWDAWSIDESMIYALVAQRFVWSAAIAFYTIGPGGQLNAQIPARIYKAWYVTASGGAPQSSSIEAGGSGYAVNDTGTVLGADGSLATYTVTGAAAGAVTSATLSGGTGYQPGYGYATATGGGQPGVGTGFFVNILTVSTGGMNRNPLDIVDATEYNSHRDLATQGLIPDELYPDYLPDGNGFARLYLFPMPTGTGTLDLETAVAFTTWSLTGTYFIPPGFQDAIQKALAWRLLPRFGAAVQQQVAEVIRELGQKAEMRITGSNSFNRQKPMPQAQGEGGGSPVTTPAMAGFQGLQPGK